MPELAEELLRLLHEHEPAAEIFLRDLYRAGLIPGARSLRSVTVNGVRHGEPPWPVRLSVVGSKGYAIPGGGEGAAEK